ncbi:hypothetical protein KKP62_10275 [Rhodococcus sp. GOMB7]|uniref:hypothetical protein n=1 Tax=Rhodococcus sp. GOMB7 TaxID=2839033 RepID=UPI001BFFEC61|nr:hypothetical protein [Rhodococcus sp. GOMB7]MBT9295348.1 hypothetical protein [Rhodococcus sp. GOMB7]
MILILAMVAMIVWALLEFSTRPTRKPLTEADVYEAMTGRKQCSKAKFLATDQFEAWTHCPSCGEFDCHAMREPLPWIRQDWLAWNSGRTAWIERNTWTQTITSWGGHTSKVIDSAPEYPIAEPVNETRFATIRICKCGKEWGQK